MTLEQALRKLQVELQEPVLAVHLVRSADPRHARDLEMDCERALVTLGLLLYGAWRVPSGKGELNSRLDRLSARRCACGCGGSLAHRVEKARQLLDSDSYPDPFPCAFFSCFVAELHKHAEDSFVHDLLLTGLEHLPKQVVWNLATRIGYVADGRIEFGFTQDAFRFVPQFEEEHEAQP
jgi:hypothetical protein